MKFSNLLHSAARFAKNLDHSNNGVKKNDIPLVELNNYLNTISLDQLRISIESLYEIAEKRPAKVQQVFETLADTMKEIYESRR